MAFRLADVKKTVRSRSDGERYLHPKLLDGVAVTTQVALALSYFHTRLGRTRGEIDPETLVRFFGDPKVARGLVACLHTAYRWRSREFGEVLDAPQVARLAARGIFTPCDLRLYLYDAMNAGAYGGFLPAEREEHLWPLARKLRLTPAKLDQLAALDALENAVLVRLGAAPEPEHVVALYNFYVVEAILRHSVYAELTGVGNAQRESIETACRRYGVVCTWRGDDVRLHNQADLFGSYARHGARLTRALFEGAASAPRLLAHGRAQVRLPGKTAYYLLDRETPRALTGATGAIRAGAPWPELREAWDRHRAAHGTAGWRLLGAPDPLLTPAGLALAPFAARRDETQVLLWPARGTTELGDALALREAGVEVLPIAWPDASAALPANVPAARADDGVAGVIDALDAHWSGGRVPADAQALEGLLHEVAEHGFVADDVAAEALGCASVGDLAPRLRSLDAAQARYVPGLGLCSPDFAEKMRKGLRRRRPAA